LRIADFEIGIGRKAFSSRLPDPQSEIRNSQFLSGSGSRAIARLRIPPGRERSNGSSSRMCRGHSGA